MMDKDMNKKDHESMSAPEEKIVYAADLVVMLKDMWIKINGLFNKTQSLSDRRFRIFDNGRIVAVMDRYVDIDCEALGKIPWLREDDRLIVMADETHSGEKSVYKIYNVGSIPNVKYLGFAEPDTYPTVTAVEQYVSKAVAQSEHRLEKKFADMMGSFENVHARMDGLEAKLKSKNK